MMTPKEVASQIVKTLDAKKAGDIRMLRTQDVTILADYFVICTASSTTQLKSLADEVDYVLSGMGEAPLRTEGTRECGWMLVDFGCVVVHLFLRDKREFYNLERLWGDAPAEEIASLLAEGKPDHTEEKSE